MTNRGLLLADPGVYGPVFQGEGDLIGSPTIFVRLAGCNDRCVWCDTMHAVDAAKYKKEWTRWRVDEVVQAVERLSYPGCWVTLSGGNPALQDCSDLIDRLHDRGIRVAVETQGTHAPRWFASVDHLTLSPKPPSSGNETRAEQVIECLARTGWAAVKIVVFDDADLDYAQRMFAALEKCTISRVVQAGSHLDGDAHSILARLGQLERKVAVRKMDVRVLPQLHTLVHGSRRDA